jgi:hypothetical protein
MVGVKLKLGGFGLKTQRCKQRNAGSYEKGAVAESLGFEWKNK